MYPGTPTEQSECDSTGEFITRLIWPTFCQNTGWDNDIVTAKQPCVTPDGATSIFPALQTVRQSRRSEEAL